MVLPLSHWREGCAKAVDRIIFIKNGYSLLRHLVPFAIASLLLLVLAGNQASSDDLLFKMLRQLRKPTMLWVPATVLTLVTLLIYVVHIRNEIQDAYLFKEDLSRKTFATAVLYLAVCTSIAVAVVCEVTKTGVGLVTVWVGLLISGLSMTGVEWKLPRELVGAVGIKVPNYEKTEEYISGVKDIITRLKTEVGTSEDVEGIKKHLQGLAQSIEVNLKLEPVWAREELTHICSDLEALVRALQNQFVGHPDAIRDIYVAWKYQKGIKYNDFIQPLRAIHKYWPDLKVD